MLTPSRRALEEKCPLYYPFGNTIARNVLKDCQFASDNIKVLFLGSGDLRNALKTAAENREKIQNFHIHLNDLNPSVVARNILILKIISAESFDIQNEEDTSFLWDIWYNAEWSETTRRRFESVLKELDKNLPDNVAIPKSCSFKTMKTVWSSWSSITSKSKSESDLFMKKIRKERKSIMFNGWFRIHKIEVDPNESPSSLFPKIVNRNADYFAATFKDFDSSLKQKIHEEARQYFSTGSCRLKIEVDNVCVNPTMLDPTTSCWHVHYQLCPFDGYLPLTREELDTSNDEGILIRTSHKILKNLVADYKKRIDGIKIFFHLEDALEFCLSDSTLSFDVIDCSNLADHIGLVHLINACEKILTDTPEARFFTDTLSWKRAATSALQYVEETLCCPLSMIPTIYGLILTNHVELGSSIPTNNLLGVKIPPIMLCWKKAPTFQNVKLSPSPELSRCLNQLAQRCFLPHNLENYNYSKKTTESGARIVYCEMLRFTPLTFSYVVNSMIGRVEVDSRFSADPAEIPSVYKLSRRTLEAWKDNEIPLKLSSDLQTNFLDQIPPGKISGGFQNTSAMRLILVPHHKFVKSYLEAISQQQLSDLQEGFSDPKIHVIDNFQLEVKQAADGDIQTARISFLLMPDHGLDETHQAYVFDVMDSLFPIFVFEPVSSMQVEEYRQPYPFSPPKRPQVPVVTKQSNMRVDSCIESADNYTLQISIECRQNISGLKVSPDQCLPCESVHGLTLSLSQPKGIEPLALNFPFPILVKEIRATLHRQNRLIDLVLKKALYEPWPYEFQAKQSRWNVDNLKPWKDRTGVELGLTTHLNIQFKMNVLLHSYQSEDRHKTDSASKMSTLNEVRDTIKSLIESNQEFISIRRKDSSRSADWFLRVHLPVRISPLGSPILLLSAVDHRLVEDLISQGKADSQESLNDFTRIFEAPRCKNNANAVLMTIWTFTAEEEQLLRYVLRLNSTKIMPSIWQKNNLPLGENSPWLATFVSPLYDDFPTDKELVDTVQIQEEIKTGQSNCAACKKSSQNLKRCSRCRTIFYCSVECQRGHWTIHKNACNNSGK